MSQFLELFEFDSNYFSSIFGETERLNAKYLEEVEKLKEDLKKAIEKQEFEVAAKLRDEIRELEGGI